MTSKDTAYMTSNPEVVAAYEKWKADALVILAKRNALIEAVGRNLWIGGHGYSTYVTGFERFDSDVDGDLVSSNGGPGGMGVLVVSSQRGQHGGRVVPNLRRKAGKEFAEELRGYTVPGLDLPGMPGMHVYMSGAGMVMGHANIWLWEGALYALWGCDDAPVKAPWQQILLSQYHAALEWYEIETDTVSGNEESA